METGAYGPFSHWVRAYGRCQAHRGAKRTRRQSTDRAGPTPWVARAVPTDGPRRGKTRSAQHQLPGRDAPARNDRALQRGRPVRRAVADRAQPVAALLARAAGGIFDA